MDRCTKTVFTKQTSAYISTLIHDPRRQKLFKTIQKKHIPSRELRYPTLEKNELHQFKSASGPGDYVSFQEWFIFSCKLSFRKRNDSESHDGTMLKWYNYSWWLFPKPFEKYSLYIQSYLLRFGVSGMFWGPPNIFSVSVKFGCPGISQIGSWNPKVWGENSKKYLLVGGFNPFEKY